ncbi:MAG: sensor histidine kinase, partial [Candidatus Nanopelagicales bacterium]
MKLKFRLTLFTVLIIALSSGGVGIFTVFSQYFGEVNAIQRNLNQIDSQLALQDNQNISTVLALAAGLDIRTSLYLIDEDDSLNPIVDNANIGSIFDSDEESIQAELVRANPILRFNDVEIDGQLKLILIASVQDEIDRRNTNLFTLIIFITIFSILGTQILRKLIFKDVLREAEHQSLLEKVKVQESKNRALIEFASETSHEIKTPLTIIKGNLQLQQMRPIDKELKTTNRKMLDEVDRIESNLNSLLTLMEFETIQEVDFKALNISEISESELETFCEISPEKVVVSKIEPEIWINGLKELYLSIIRNILSNIQRHAESSASVSLQLTAENGSARLVIENSGELSDSFNIDLPALNQRFNSDRAWIKGGSGLGLPIVNKAVSRLNGELTLSKSASGGLAVDI